MVGAGVAGALAAGEYALLVCALRRRRSLPPCTSCAAGISSNLRGVKALVSRLKAAMRRQCSPRSFGLVPGPQSALCRWSTPSDPTCQVRNGCGSTLASLAFADLIYQQWMDTHRYFEEFVSFPFVPGHEVVAETDDGRRCARACARSRGPGFDPPFDGARPGDGDDYRHLTSGRIEPGIQTGFCESTGGAWSASSLRKPTATCRTG